MRKARWSERTAATSEDLNPSRKRHRSLRGLAAGSWSGKDLAGIGPAVGIEGAAQQPHRLEIVRRKHPIEIAPLVRSDPVLTTDAAARRQTFLEDGCTQLLHPRLRPRLSGVVKDEGMKIAVAGMEDIGDGQTMIPAQPFDGSQNRWKAASGNHAVLDVVSGSDLANG